MRRPLISCVSASLLLLMAGAPAAIGQTGTLGRDSNADEGRSLIVPQAWRHDRRRPVPQVDLTAVNVDVKIREQVATTSMELMLRNPHGGPLEAELVIPVPDGCTIRGVQFDGTGPEPTAKILPRDEARRIYDEIVRRRIDPALVEFAGYNLIRTSAFPIPANTTQKLTVIFEQILPSDGNRVDYILPRSEGLADPTVTWTMRAEIAAEKGVGTVYSPSHDLAISVKNDASVTATISGQAMGTGPVRLSYLQSKSGLNEPTATFMAYPDPTLGDGKGGYFLMLAKLPDTHRDTTVRALRDIVLVLDRSGSMRGDKLEQARRAAIQVIEGLHDGDCFNIIDYSDSVASFSDAAVVKSADTSARARAYLNGLEANGGTNIHDALLEGVRANALPRSLPMILFLTDGLATVGETREKAIRDAITKANQFERRIFGFGVGYDVNIPLLNAVSTSSGGATTMIAPGEDVESKVSQVFSRLRGPALIKPSIESLDAEGQENARLIRELQPGRMGDIFDGDQIVVLGQYTSDQPMRVRLNGKVTGSAREDASYTFSFDPSHATVRNNFVPRIWATRKIASLAESVRQNAADGSQANEELIAEIVRLSTRWGIMTEYTSFLAVEDDTLMPSVKPGAPRAPGEAALHERVQLEAGKTVSARSGAGGAAQQRNVQDRAESLNVQAGQRLVDRDMKSQTFNRVQNIADRTLFWRDNRWVDSLLGGQEKSSPEQTIEFGTKEYQALVDELARDGRQGLIAIEGDVYLLHGGKRTLVRGPVENQQGK
jgi:Ca-activated chloride channel family protein